MHWVQYHPDKHAGSASGPDSTSTADKFQKVSKAYDILGNAESRREFDSRTKGKLTCKTIT